MISWVHFGDLHIRDAKGENYLDFLSLIEDVNRNLAGHVDFAFLPGDNADDGTEDQYQLVKNAISGLRLPVHVITGDHDRKGGTLGNFQCYLESELYRAVVAGGFQLLFLNAMDGPDKKTFDLGVAQMAWLRQHLAAGQEKNLRPIVFVHLYPSELATQGAELTRLIREFRVELVEMGHTHYNELANNGATIYATTRSTGQIEEGPPGFSVTTIDEDVVSWKFRERGTGPFLMITSPADKCLITRPDSARHVLRGQVTIRARLWGADSGASVYCHVDYGAPQAMHWRNEAWECAWDTRSAADGIHRILVESEGAQDSIAVVVNQRGLYDAPVRHAVDYENVIGAYPAKGILGSQLGPNENGTKGPWPSWRGK